MGAEIGNRPNEFDNHHDQQDHEETPIPVPRIIPPPIHDGHIARFMTHLRFVHRLRVPECSASD